ncbi:MAG: DUF2721 domain-containing protein [Chloroflexi bacterium]|nr:DUF2721 domain-containing protein [Chloroflexota bacterium]
MISWLQPLILLPGVALLIISTSARYEQLQEEIHHLLMEAMPLSDMVLEHLDDRVHLYRNTLTALYLSVVLFALGSLLGVLTLPMGDAVSGTVALSFTGVGCVGLLFAAAQLVRESFLTTEVLQDHVRQLKDLRGG